MSERLVLHNRALELAAEREPTSHPERSDAVLTEAAELVYGPYQALAARLSAAKEAGLEQAEYTRLHERLVRIFLAKHTRDELPYIVDGLPPSTEMMRVLMDKIIPGLPTLPDTTVGDIRLQPQADYTTHQGAINGVIAYSMFQGDSLVADRSLPIHDGELVTDWPDPDGRSRPIQDVTSFQKMNGKVYAVLRLEVNDWGNSKQYYVLDDQTLQLVDGQTVSRIYFFRPEPDGRTWSGAIERWIDGNARGYPVIHGQVKERLSTGQVIKTTLSDSYINGELCCALLARVLSPDGHELIHLLVNGREISAIHDQSITRVYYLSSNQDGIFDVYNQKTQRGRTVLVNKGRIQRDLTPGMLGHQIKQGEVQVFKLRGRRIFGQHRIRDFGGSHQEHLPVVNGETVTELGGRPIEAVLRIEFSEDDRWSGIVCFDPSGEIGGSVPRQSVYGVMLDGELITEIDGRGIQRLDLDTILFFDRTMDSFSGTVKLAGEDRFRKYLLGEWKYE